MTRGVARATAARAEALPHHSSPQFNIGHGGCRSSQAYLHAAVVRHPVAIGAPFYDDRFLYLTFVRAPCKPM